MDTFYYLWSFTYKKQKSNKVIFIASSLLLITSSFMIFLDIVTGIIFVTVSSMP